MTSKLKKIQIIKMNLIFVLGFYLLSISGQSAVLNDVKMSDNITVEAKNLILNGMGLRKVHKFGIPVKVYVAGLYLENKNRDAEALVKNDEIKKLVMHFLRPVDRDVLIDSFRASYNDGCYLDCDKKGPQFSKLAENIVSVRKDNEMAFTFYKDKIEINTNGPNAKKATVNDANLSRNMLSLFINKKKPPTEELRKGLLGL